MRKTKAENIASAAADVVRAAAGRKKYKRTTAVILSAGNSCRMKGKDKQFLTVCGMPVLARSIRAFENSPCIKDIVVVTKEDKIRDVITLCEKYGFKKVYAVVAGGENRQTSAWLGFRQVSDKAEFVAFHDGARCLVDPDDIEKVCLAAYEFGAATAATAATDTVKKANASGFIEGSEDRNFVWLAQTPQVFGTNLYRASGYTAREANFFATDDCSLAERIGFKGIKLVETGKKNIKITTPDDVFLAEALIGAEKRAKEKENADR